MSRRQQLLAILLGLLALGWGVFVMFRATITVSRVGSVLLVIGGLVAVVPTVLASRRQRRGDAAR